MEEVLPYALQYGQDEYSFWHGDKRLFVVYQKAYYRRLYDTAWANGLYVDAAVQTTAANILAKKGSRPVEYPKEPFDPFKKQIVLDKEEIANEYVGIQRKQNQFIKDLLNRERTT